MKESTAILPEEWMKLVKDAMNSNVSKEDFKQFLEAKSQDNTIAKNIR
ncbi:DNA-binding anti-repressor SinI [Priestia megaterium]|nr:anti-repressor SinI family protein [Priestia megaterium]MBV6738392.1 anti-repressor SinI family protein [Priestia megaterium]MCM3020213.1 anti-repressor SinI family protein [Priestia megaterium]PEB60997.1 DNA-binding anti-repressor SinI [Priestia megaterium]PFA99856.1 DNA-binding anti-repressor SinI [Priestia megaterium]PGT76124.1 DNA-binding anti-repressor SinI [Priestia megaterium]